MCSPKWPRVKAFPKADTDLEQPEPTSSFLYPYLDEKGKAIIKRRKHRDKGILSPEQRAKILIRLMRLNIITR